MQGQRVCKFFLKNSCNKGDQCIFKHDEAEKDKMQKEQPFQRKFQNDQNGGGENKYQFNRDFQQKRPFQGGFQREKQHQNQFGGRQPFNQNQQQRNDRNDRNDRNEFNNRNEFNDRNEQNNRNEESNRNQENPNRQNFQNKNDQQENRQQRPFNFQRNPNFDDQKQNQFRNKFQQNRNQNFNQEQNQNQNENRNNYEFNRPFRNNGQFTRQNNGGNVLECEKKVFKKIQSLYVQDFVQAIYIEQFKLLGIAKKNQIIFFKVSEQIEICNKSSVQLPDNTTLIYQMWHQMINNQLVLILSYQAKKIQLRNIAIYPNLWDSYFHITIYDVCLQEIVSCKIIGNLCLVFCNDGNLRVYTLTNTSALLPPRIYNFNSPIETAISITVLDENEEMQYIGLRNGELLTFQNGQMISIPHELNNQQFSVVDLKYDQKYKILFILFWQVEKSLSQILALDFLTRSIKSIHQLNIHIFQIECIQDYLICSNALGVLDILKRNSNNEYISYSYYPNQIQQYKKYNKISSVINISFANVNSVIFDYLLVGRMTESNPQSNYEEENVDLLGFE